MNHRYLPVLRTKAGEANALSTLPPSAKQRLLPIVQLTAKPAATFTSELAKGWSGLPLALDGLYSMGATNSSNDYVSMFGALGTSSVKVIPSIECGTSAAYVAAVKTLIGQFAPGLVVQATLGQVPTVSAWVASQGWPTAAVDLAINVGHVGAHDPNSFSGYVAHALAQLPQVWRSVTLVAAAAPKDYSGLPLGRSIVTRSDWLLWQQVHNRLPYKLDYGDYGISHPDLSEVPGVAMAKASVSVRYTINNDWVILKGNSTTGPSGQPMKHQYLQHARSLMTEAQFGGIGNCWGDQRIQQISALPPGASGTGSRATWVTIGASRHLSLVAARLP